MGPDGSYGAPSCAEAATRPLRLVWLGAGACCLVVGTVGIVVPLLPTVDFYALAAFCFARGSRRWQRWLLDHPRIGPLVREWRAERSIPLKVKWLASVSMTASCVWAAHALPARTAWIAAAVCVPIAVYLWTRPTRRDPNPAQPRAENRTGWHADLA